VRCRPRSALALLACLVPFAGCASLGLGLARSLPDGGGECPGALVPTQQIEGEFLLRQSVRVQGDGLDWRLSLVAQKRGDTLLLIGLDAFGGKQFLLTQTGSAVEVERPRGRLPLSPVSLLLDWQRVRLAEPGAAPEAGVSVTRAADGGVTIEHASCGYRATFVALEETPLPAAAGAAP
jgi:hypothetical protein